MKTNAWNRHRDRYQEHSSGLRTVANILCRGPDQTFDLEISLISRLWQLSRNTFTRVQSLCAPASVSETVTLTITIIRGRCHSLSLMWRRCPRDRGSVGIHSWHMQGMQRQQIAECSKYCSLHKALYNAQQIMCSASRVAFQFLRIGGKTCISQIVRGRDMVTIAFGHADAPCRRQKTSSKISRYAVNVFAQSV